MFFLFDYYFELNITKTNYSIKPNNQNAIFSYSKSPLLKGPNHCDSLACNTFATSSKSKLFGCRTLDANLPYVNVQNACNICLHLFLVRIDFGPFTHDNAIDIDNFVTCFCDFFAHLPQKFKAICILESRIRIGEIRADVTQATSSQQRIAYSMQQNVGIAGPKQTFFVGDVYPSNNALATFHQFVDIKTYSRTINFFHKNTLKNCGQPIGQPQKFLTNNQSELRQDANYNQCDCRHSHSKFEHVTEWRTVRTHALAFTLGLERHEQHKGDAHVVNRSHQ